MTPSGGSATTVKDDYQLGQLASQTDGNNTLLATYTYDANGTPVSVQVGPDLSNPQTTPRYYYIYNAHGDVVNLVDASGNPVASYTYDTWGNLISATESFANGWSNPYRYDGRDGVRYDASDGLYWMSVRAYDPTIGRFIAHDPLGRAPLFFSDQPYAYAGNNPVSNVDPSGQYRASGSGARESTKQTKENFARVAKQRGCGSDCKARVHKQWLKVVHGQQQTVAGDFTTEAGKFNRWGIKLAILTTFLLGLGAALTMFGATAVVGYALLQIGVAVGLLSGAAFLVSAWLSDLSLKSVGSDSSVGWFTHAHLDNCDYTCFDVAAQLPLGLSLAYGASVSIMGLIKLISAGTVTAASAEAAAAAAMGTGVFVGGLLSLYVMLIGSHVLQSEIDRFIQQEEYKEWA